MGESFDRSQHRALLQSRATQPRRAVVYEHLPSIFLVMHVARQELLRPLHLQLLATTSM